VCEPNKWIYSPLKESSGLPVVSVSESLGDVFAIQVRQSAGSSELPTSIRMFTDLFPRELKTFYFRRAYLCDQARLWLQERASIKFSN